MSTYATIQGQVKFTDKEKFDALVKFLLEGKWINNEMNFTDECDNPIENGSESPSIDTKEQTIVIPYTCYRNLIHHLDKFFLGGEGAIVWTSTDGMCSGGIIEDGNETTYDLLKWAKDEEIERGDEEDDIDYFTRLEDLFHEEYAV